jgi:MFS family permease
VTATYSAGYRAWLVGVLVAVYACGFIDRVVVATVGPALIRDLRLSDLEFGLLGGMAFALFYTAFGVPVARLAERRARVPLIAASVALWSAMTACCGLAQSYWQLLLCRVGVGIGEAGCTPPAHSLISDHFPADRRASILSIYSAGMPIGAMLGAVAGGWLAQSFNWRVAFVVVGAPGLLLALLVRLTLREPPRGFAERAIDVGIPPPWRAVVRRLWESRLFRHVCAGCGLTTLAGNSISLFTPTYLVRSFGMGMARAGALYGLVMGVAGAVGIIAGGIGVDAGARRDRRWYAWGPALGVAVGCPLYVLAFSQTTAPATLGLLLAGATCVSVYFAPSFAVAQNLVEPRMRASASAMLLFVINVLGQGFGPLALGKVSDVASSRAFAAGSYQAICVNAHPTGAMASACVAASASGLRVAILASTIFLLWGAVHYALAAGTAARELPEG